MRRLIPCITLAFSLLSTSLAAAQEKVVKNTNEANLVSPLRKGQPAPFPGVLFSQRATATIITDVKAVDERVKIEVTSAVKEAEARKQFEIDETKSRCKSDTAVLTADREEKMKRIALLEDELKKTSAASPSRTLWLGIGAGAGIVLTVVTVFAVSQASK